MASTTTTTTNTAGKQPHSHDQKGHHPKPLSLIPVSFASCSIGLPRHTLHQKIEALTQAGFTGLELSFPDLRAFAARHHGHDAIDAIAEDDYDNLCAAGHQVRKLCAAHGLTVIVLQPFANFEGWAKGSVQRDEAFARARGWIRVMEAVGTDMLQVGSSDSAGPDSLLEDKASKEDLAGDLGELADMLAVKGFRLAYENWCWATRAPTWRDVWEIVALTGRQNVGLCLDTFQSAGGEWGDPTTKSGRLEEGGTVKQELESQWRDSLRELARTVPAEKIYFLQVSDAYRVDPPLGTEMDEDGLRPRGRWSHDYRPLPDDGGYLPIVDFVEAVLATGFRGWFSMEVFDGKFEEKYGDRLDTYAKKAMEAHENLLKRVDMAKVANLLE